MSRRERKRLLRQRRRERKRQRDKIFHEFTDRRGRWITQIPESYNDPDHGLKNDGYRDTRRWRNLRTETHVHPGTGSVS